ncbi:hypothetical protein K439DRAFT_80170 [Ramaria rubella]|nr:hypothetical protein K439DRAFT_80170 [Ramaria rubella]
MFQDLPHHSNIVRVKKDVDLKRKEQEELEPAIQILSLALEGLTNRHSQLANEIEFANASIAPIRHLPLETLSNIFEFCALHDDSAPLPLSRVCRKWKEAATSPQIWSRIVIDLDNPNAQEKAALFLLRSRSTKLDIELRRPGFNDSGWAAWYEVLTHSRRWRSLEISASTYGLVNDVLDELPMCAPNLVHSTITVEGFFFMDTANHFDFQRLELPADLLSYTKFRSLRLQTWALPMLSLNPTCVLAQLTTLHLTDTYASTFRMSDRIRPHPICGNAISVVLSLCPLLETFTFNARESIAYHSGTCCQDPSHTHGQHTLPALRHLSLITHHLDTFAIMNGLVCPALRAASIEPLPRYSSGLTETFGIVWRDLLRRSQAPPLEELHVSAMAPEDIVWTLERSPRLRCLGLAYCTNPMLVLKALATPYAYKGRGEFTGKIRWVCPKLSRFYFKDCFLVSWHSVARLVRNRHRAYLDGKKLALMVHLVINEHDVFEDRDLNALASFKLRQIATLIEP